ncbi:hypothetical protein M4I21_01915 [Cellulophaga sp. 20_2_10]|uniref:hypothetical protein n=1 Tax=Cellulophaga sp. 20_2_10 TaxID=2942476 RepID=UPI00201B34A4|nr:hypothetical protein [Cellulophaga sp. 20_2_10]MCL5244545.1 hypothetical protein [Cellulophaga sp. 20_2_10]
MKIIGRIASVFMLVLITSCGGSSEETIRISTPEGLAKAKELMVSSFGPDLEIYKLRLNSAEDLSSDLGTLAISYHKDGKLYTRTYNSKTDYKEAALGEEELQSKNFQSAFFIKNAQGKLKVSDIDVTAIMANIDKAVALVSEEIEVKNYQVRNYYLSVDSKTNKVTADFELHVTKPDNKSVEGRNIVTNFYEVKFSSDEEGNVTIKD